MSERAAPSRLRHLFAVLPQPASPGARVGRLVALAVATAAPLGAAVIMRSWGSGLPAALWIPAALLVASAALAHHGEVGSQLLARSVWWAHLVLGTLISFTGSSRERPLGVLLALLTGATLLLMGRMGLDEDERSAFRPVAFRTTLAAGMIMAVADAQALVLFGAIQLEEYLTHSYASTNDGLQGAALLASAAVVVIAIAGLYRLRVWGLLLAALSAAAVAALAYADVYGLKGPIMVGLIVTSVVQLLLPIPVVAAIVRRRAPSPTAAGARLARVLPAALVALLMAGAAAGGLCGERLFD